MQISGANSEHKHSKIERFMVLNKRKIVKTQKTPSLSIANKLSDLH